MSGDESIDDEYYNQLSDACDFLTPANRLASRLRSSNNFLRNDSEVFSNSIRRHRDRMLESVVKLYRGRKF